MRKTAISTGVIGLVLLIAAGLMAWWITPSYIARMPGSYNTTRTYDATIRSLFNPSALATGNLAGAIKTGLAGTVSETVKVQQTSGNTALIQDTRAITAAGAPVGQTVSPYALDRKSLEPASSHPSSWNVIPAKGLTVSWPLGAKQQNYTGWVFQTGTTTTLRYVKQVQQGGINTYEYQATVPATPITNAQLLASLPKSLPVSLLPKLSAAGLVSPTLLASLAKAFPGATSVPLAYTHQAANTYYVAPATGLVVNLSNNETDDGRHRAARRQVHPGAPGPGVHLPRQPRQPVGRGERRQQREQHDHHLGSDRTDHRGGGRIRPCAPRHLPVDARRQPGPPGRVRSP